jgi:hypothetical protein
MPPTPWDSLSSAERESLLRPPSSDLYANGDRVFLLPDFERVDRPSPAPTTENQLPLDEYDPSTLLSRARHLASFLPANSYSGRGFTRDPDMDTRAIHLILSGRAPHLNPDGSFYRGEGTRWTSELLDVPPSAVTPSQSRSTRARYKSLISLLRPLLAPATLDEQDDPHPLT